MAGRVIFSVRSPLGYQVTLTRNRWREVVRYKHPALAGSEQALRRCVEAPAMVRESIKDWSVHLYLPVRDMSTCALWLLPRRARSALW